MTNFLLLVPRTVFSVILVLAFVSIASAHPFHSSVAEMEWNEEATCFEVTVQMAPHDLEQTLRKLTGKKLMLEEKDSKEAVFDYVKSEFRLVVDGTPATIKPVGFEVNPRHAIVYFEVSLPKGRSSMQVENKLLLNIHHQVNTLTIRQSGKPLALNFTEESPSQKVDWNKDESRFVLVEKKQVASQK